MELFGNIFQNTISSHKPVQEFVSKHGLLSTGLNWFLYVWKYWQHALIRKLLIFGYVDILIYQTKAKIWTKTSMVWQGWLNFELNPWAVLQQKYCITTLFLFLSTQLSLRKLCWFDLIWQFSKKVANCFICFFTRTEFFGS